MDSQPQKKYIGERIGRFFSMHWHRISVGCGTLALAAAGAPELFSAPDPVPHVFIGEWGWAQYLFLAGAALFVAGGAGHVFIRPTFGQLLGQRDVAISTAEDRANALESVLRAVINELTRELGLDLPTARASVYCLSDAGFVLLSRVSANPELKKRGRASYPVGQGLIGKAWRERSGVLVNLPKDRSDWEAQLLEVSFTSDEVGTLAMQSRSLVAVRIDATLPSEKDPIGVLVLESESARGVNGSTLDALLASRTWIILQNAMANAREHFPVVAQSLIQRAPGNKKSGEKRGRERQELVA